MTTRRVILIQTVVQSLAPFRASNSVNTVTNSLALMSREAKLAAKACLAGGDLLANRPIISTVAVA